MRHSSSCFWPVVAVTGSWILLWGGGCYWEPVGTTGHRTDAGQSPGDPEQPPDQESDPGPSGGDAPAVGSECGNGMIQAELNETCDPIETCPVHCNDANPCTVDTMMGHPSTCNVVCKNDPITACQDDDCCCAHDLCGAPRDTDCWSIAAATGAEGTAVGNELASTLAFQEKYGEYG